VQPAAASKAGKAPKTKLGGDSIMAMTMTGEVALPANRETVWAKLNDPAVLKACIPGCETLDKSGDNGFSAVVNNFFIYNFAICYHNYLVKQASSNCVIVGMFNDGFIS
jgi:hypothetical protein